MKVFLERHPEVSEESSRANLSRLIADAASFLPEVIWDGVSAGPVKRYKPGAYTWE